MDYKEVIIKISNAGRILLTILAVLGTIYAGLWSIGLAPLTNSQAEEMIEAKVLKTGSELKRLMIDQGITYDRRLREQKSVVDDIDNNVNAIQRQNARIDERTKRTEALLNLLLNKLGQ